MQKDKQVTATKLKLKNKSILQIQINKKMTMIH